VHARRQPPASQRDPPRLRGRVPVNQSSRQHRSNSLAQELGVTAMRSLLLAACSLLAVTPAFAQIRTAPDPTSYIDPSTTPQAARLFERNGLFRVAGGVVLGGRANFVVERAGTTQQVADNALRIEADGNGGATLIYAGATYPIRMPPGLACPLARFTERNGLIAYTATRYLDEDGRRQLLHLGIVHHRIAREFDGTPFEPLLRAADFAPTKPLPATLAQPLIAAVNHINGVNSLIVLASDTDPDWAGSMLNADVQVRYTAYLDPARHTLEMAGVPLRYFWQYGLGGVAEIFSIEALAQNWPAGTGLAAPGAKPGQTDVANFYQSAGLFREMHVADGPAFAEFTERVCAPLVKS
jgi:hypothetical protein